MINFAKVLHFAAAAPVLKVLSFFKNIMISRSVCTLISLFYTFFCLRYTPILVHKDTIRSYVHTCDHMITTARAGVHME